jgi:hypothetical protein
MPSAWSPVTLPTVVEGGATPAKPDVTKVVLAGIRSVRITLSTASPGRDVFALLPTTIVYRR